MLVLERKTGEKIHLILPSGEEAIITLSSVRKDGRARIGFDVPSAWKVAREEVYDLVKAGPTKREFSNGSVWC